MIILRSLRWAFIGVWFIAINYAAMYGLSMFCYVVIGEKYDTEIALFLLISLYGVFIADYYITRNEIRASQ